MKNGFLVGLLLLGSAGSGWAQVGGNAASRGNNNSAYLAQLDPAQAERAKRQPTAAELREDNTATFLEASILMNVAADEYVAVFGVLQQGKTPEESSARMDATIARFKAALAPLGVKEKDLFVDFVTQNRVYGYRLEEKALKNPKPDNDEDAITVETTAIEELAGFELKKNVSIHFKDRLLVDKLVSAAAQSQIYDLIKVDYVVKDLAKHQAQLQTQTMALLKGKFERYQTLLGVELTPPTQVVADKPGLYYPVEQYASYSATESEQLEPAYNRSRVTIKNLRKGRTTYFNPLSGNGFDTVINPVIIEPVVQLTTYIKVRCEPRNKPMK